MRLMIGALLLASVAAVPAMAQDRQHGGWHQDSGGDHGDQGGNRGGGHEGRGDGGNRSGGAPQVQVHAPNPQQTQRPDFQRPDRPQGGFGGDRGGGVQARGGAGFQPQGGTPDGGHRVHGQPDNGVQVWRNDRGTAQRPDWSNRPGDRPGGWDQNRDGRPDGNSAGNRDRNHDGRPDWQNGDRGRPGNWDRGRGDWNNNHNGGWNNSWRSDRRYDWRGWRNSHRDYYRVGRYRAPWGYSGGYRRWGIGVRIDPIFFAQDYWIDNPDYYRLPPAYGSYRWVRYYNDALLVDIYSGTVVDEIPDFFW